MLCAAANSCMRCSGVEGALFACAGRLRQLPVIPRVGVQPQGVCRHERGCFHLQRVQQACNRELQRVPLLPAMMLQECCDAMWRHSYTQVLFTCFHSHKCCADECPRQTSMAGQARVLAFAAHPLHVTITPATHEVHPAGISSVLQGHGSMQQGPALLRPHGFSYSVLVLLRWRGCGCAALCALPRLQWALACPSMACGITAATPWGRRHMYAPVAVACSIAGSMAACWWSGPCEGRVTASWQQWWGSLLAACTDVPSTTVYARPKSSNTPLSCVFSVHTHTAQPAPQAAKRSCSPYVSMCRVPDFLSSVCAVLAEWLKGCAAHNVFLSCCLWRAWHAAVERAVHDK